MSKIDPRLYLFLIFLKIGAFSFGGAYTIWGMTEQEFIKSQDTIEEVFQKVLPEDLFFNYIEIGRMTPGPNINGVLLVGHYFEGFTGMILAMIGLVLPSFVIILLLYHLNRHWGHTYYFRWFKDGALAAVIAILVFFVLKMSERAPDYVTWQIVSFWLLAVFSFVLIHMQKANVFIVTLFCGLVTWCFQWM